MLGACNQCGNALGECECFREMGTEEGMVGRTETLPIYLSKGPSIYIAEETQREAYGKACYLAFWGFLPLQAWEDMSETHRERWRAAAVSTAIEVMRSPMVKT